MFFIPQCFKIDKLNVDTQDKNCYEDTKVFFITNNTKNIAFLNKDLIIITDSYQIECHKKDTQIILHGMKKILVHKANKVTLIDARPYYEKLIKPKLYQIHRLNYHHSKSVTDGLYFNQRLLTVDRQNLIQYNEDKKESSSSISFKVLQDSIGDFSKKIYFDLKIWILIGIISMLTFVIMVILIWCLIRYIKCKQCFTKKANSKPTNIELNENLNIRTSSLENNISNIHDNLSITRGQLRLKEVLNAQGLQEMDNHFHDN
jgi:hypothetical protein